MTSPAFRALKKHLRCHITLLTSTAGSLIAPCLPDVDEVIVYDVPWVKSSTSMKGQTTQAMITDLALREFDGAIVFTVYSQSALPTALTLLMAGIPLRAAFARENPYQLLTHWVPDKEPYSFIRHQVERDLLLVQELGVPVESSRLRLDVTDNQRMSMTSRLEEWDISRGRSFIVMHPGVSETRRQYPSDSWAALIELLRKQTGIPVLVTGSNLEKEFTSGLVSKVNHREGVIDTAGRFTVTEFVALIERASLVISVNTAASHIAAAMSTPLIVLYAMTNPQHVPWSSESVVIPFPVERSGESRNEVVRFVARKLRRMADHMPDPAMIARRAISVLTSASQSQLSGSPGARERYPIL